MDSQRLLKLEMFAAGAFTAVTFMDVDNLLGFQVPLIAKIFAVLIVFIGWVVYLFKGDGNKNAMPSQVFPEQKVKTRNKILSLLLVGVFIGFLSILLIKK